MSLYLRDVNRILRRIFGPNRMGLGCGEGFTIRKFIVWGLNLEEKMGKETSRKVLANMGGQY